MFNPPIQMNFRTGRGAQAPMPSPGGYGAPLNYPVIGAAQPNVRPAGAGPITDPSSWAGSGGFNRAAFLSVPPNGFTGPNKLNAVWIGDVKHGVWIW